MVIGKGYTDRFLSEAEARDILQEGLDALPIAGKRVLIIIPDSTRSAPLPLFFRLFCELLNKRVAKLDFLIALGTHRAMDEAQICAHVGISLQERAARYADIGIYNHDYQRDLRHIGVIAAAELRELTNGLLDEDVPVEVNARLFDYDYLILCGPVFPHEVAGFSGGVKYLFPGVSGGAIIDASHWIAALMSNMETIGLPDRPMRKIIERAARMIDIPQSCASLVVKGHSDLAGLYFGNPQESQAAAAELSAKVNIVWVSKPYNTVLSVMPHIYDDIWTASKGMYKVEPAVADGGTVIIYAPHIDEIAYTHGKVLDRIGYHVRDYFLAHWDEVKDNPRSVMCHSVLLKGAGRYAYGVETPRVRVVLASGVPRERCQRVNLGYMDPASINPQDWMGREKEGILVVPRAGELLYRLAS
jgi:nickel-dependent lactate racemase